MPAARASTGRCQRVRARSGARSSGQEPAVDRQGGTGDEGGLVAAQERHRAGHFLGPAEPAQRDRRAERGLGRGRISLLRYQGVDHRGVAVGGADAVDPHAVGRVVQCHLAGEVHDGALARGVGTLARRAAEPEDRGHVDYGAAAGRDHVRDGVPRGQEGAAHVHRHKRVPALGGAVRDATLAEGDAGRADQQVRAAEFARALGNGCCDLVLAGNVAADRGCPTATGVDVRGDFSGGARAAVGDRDGDVLGGQPGGAGGAES